jgi:membrane protease YdiL (CAAX protease family)
LVVGLIGGAVLLQAVGYVHPGPGAGTLSQSKLLTLIAIWTTMVIAAPITEEFLFRGLLYRGLAESRLGTFGALIVTSVAFGIVHYPGFGWARVIGTGLAGLLFGLLRWGTGGIGMSIVAHIILNIIAASLLTVGILMAP